MLWVGCATGLVTTIQPFLLVKALGFKLEFSQTGIIYDISGVPCKVHCICAHKVKTTLMLLKAVSTRNKWQTNLQNDEKVL